MNARLAAMLSGVLILATGAAVWWVGRPWGAPDTSSPAAGRAVVSESPVDASPLDVDPGAVGLADETTTTTTSASDVPETIAASVVADPFIASPAMLVAITEAAAATDPDTADNSPVHVRFFGRATTPDDTPIEGVAVRAMSYNPENFHDSTSHGETATDSDGRYEILVTVPDNYARRITLMAVADDGVERSSPAFGPALHSASRLWSSVGATYEWDFVANEPHVVTGRVVDTAGNPVSRAIVAAAASMMQGNHPTGQLQAQLIPSVIANEDGAFRLTLAIPGTYVLHAGHSESALYPHRVPVQVPGIDMVDLVIPQKSATITGQLHTRFGPQVPEGLTLQLTARQHPHGDRTPIVFGRRTPAVSLPPVSVRTRTEPDGFFRFDDLEPGQYEMIILEPEWRFEMSDNRAAFFVREGQREQPRLPVILGRVVTGQVVRAGTQEPMVGIAIELRGSMTPPSPDTIVTDNSGRFETLAFARIAGFISHQPGYLVAAIHPSPGESSRLWDSTNDPLSFVVEVTPSTTVSGFVRRPNGTAVSEGTVHFAIPGHFRPLARYTPLARDGMFHIEVVANAVGRVVYRAEGRPEIPSSPIRVGEDPVDNVELVVPDGITVGGRVVAEDGGPVAGAAIRGSFSPGEHFTTDLFTTTRPDGTFEFRGLFAGNVRLIASRSGYLPGREMTYMIENNVPRSDIRIELQSQASIEGMVVDSNGTPVPQFRVSYSRGGDSSIAGGAPASNREDGTFRITGVPVGPLTLTAFSTMGQHRSPPLTVDAPATGVVLRLPVALADIPLVPDPTPAPSEQPMLLIGSVVEAGTGAPVTTFHVTGQDASHVRVRQDPQTPGVFEAEFHPISRALSLAVTAPGYSIKEIPSLAPTEEERRERLMTRRFELHPAGAVTGRVVEKETGEPMIGVRVGARQLRIHPNYPTTTHVTPSNAGSTLTDGEGRFRIGGLTWGLVQLEVTPGAEYLIANESTWLSSEVRERDVGTIVVEPKPLATLHVFHHPSGRDAANEAVTIKDTENEYVRTDADGTIARPIWRFGANVTMGIEMPQYGLLATTQPPLYVVSIPIGDVAFRVRVTSDEPELLAGYVATMTMLGTTAPRSPRFADRAQLPSSLLQFTGRPAGDPSVREFPHLFESHWRLQVHPDLAKMQREGWQIPPVLRVINLTVPTHDTVTIDLSTTQLTGRVVDTDGRPVAGATVTGQLESGSDLWRPGMTNRPTQPPIQTRANGEFQASFRLLRGNWSFRATHADSGARGSASIDLTMPRQHVDVVLDEVRQPPGTLELLILNEDGSAPFPGRVAGTIVKTETGQQPALSFNATNAEYRTELDPGEYRILPSPGVMHIAETQPSLPFIIRSGETTDVTLRWKMNMWTRLRVTSRAGNSVPETHVRLFRAQDNSPTPVAEHLMTGVRPWLIDFGTHPPGVYRVEATSPSGTRASGFVELLASGSTPLTLVLAE